MNKNLSKYPVMLESEVTLNGVCDKGTSVVFWGFPDLSVPYPMKLEIKQLFVLYSGVDINNSVSVEISTSHNLSFPVGIITCKDEECSNWLTTPQAIYTHTFDMPIILYAGEFASVIMRLVNSIFYENNIGIVMGIRGDIYSDCTPLIKSIKNYRVLENATGGTLTVIKREEDNNGKNLTANSDPYCPRCGMRNCERH